VAEVAGQVADTVKHKVAPPLLAAVIAGNTVGTPAVDGALTARVNDKNVPEQTTKANEALKESFEEFEHNLGEGMTELVARRQEDEEGR